MEHKRGDETHAVFNMALSTLERLSDILREIRMLSTQFFLASEVRQEQKLELVKQFFLNSVPMLKVEQVKPFQKRMNDFRMLRINLIQRKTGTTSSQKGNTTVFSQGLELKLNDFLVDLQLSLQEQRYFMPSKKDPRFSWSNE